MSRSGLRTDVDLLLGHLENEKGRLWQQLRRARKREAGGTAEKAALQALRDLLKDVAETLVKQLASVSMQHAEAFASLWSAAIDMMAAQEVGCGCRTPGAPIDAWPHRIATTATWHR